MLRIDSYWEIACNLLIAPFTKKIAENFRELNKIVLDRHFAGWGIKDFANSQSVD